MRFITCFNPVVLLAIIVVFIYASCNAAAAQTAGETPKILLTSTIGPIDAGIVGALEEAFTKKTGIIGEPLFFPNSPEGKKL